MRPFVVIDPHPCLRCQACLLQVFKGEQIKDFLTEGPVESFDIAILMRLPFLNERQPRLITAPILQGLCDEFRAIVHTKLFWSTTPFDELVQLADDTLACQAGVNGNGQDLAVEIIDDIKCPEGLTLEQTILDKIH